MKTANDDWPCPICGERNEWWRITCRNTGQHG